MNFLRVKGSYYEMGFQQGERFKEDIKNVFLRFASSKSLKIIKPNFVPSFIFSNILKYIVYKKWKKPIEILLPDYSERIKGISEGSKTDLSELYVIQGIEVMADDISYLLKPNNFLPPLGCSSICVLPKLFKADELLLAKNFDYLSDFVGDHIVRISQPKNGYKSIEVTYKQIAGCHDGMNEKGLVVLYNYGLSIEKTQTRIPITILVQQLLERCANVEEAVTFIRSFRYPNGAILTIADINNNAICVEITPEHIGFRKPHNGILVATNFYMSQEVKNFDIPRNAYFRKKSLPKDLINKRVHQSSEERYNRIIHLLEKEIRYSVEHLQNILKEHKGKKEGYDDTICRHGEVLSTQVSVIFLPKKRMLKISFGPPCKNEYVDFILS
ncbi:MAG: C45 family peptidase [Endomicrobia bacterium]|nr:C45 family peptidase [Endomicrobiia bacterium]